MAQSQLQCALIRSHWKPLQEEKVLPLCDWNDKLIVAFLTYVSVWLIVRQEQMQISIVIQIWAYDSTMNNAVLSVKNIVNC